MTVGMKVKAAHVLVTGGASGIGLEVCKCLANTGVASVAIFDISETALEAAQSAVEEFSRSTVEQAVTVRTYLVDVTDGAQVTISRGCSQSLAARATLIGSCMYRSKLQSSKSFLWRSSWMLSLQMQESDPVVGSSPIWLSSQSGLGAHQYTGNLYKLYCSYIPASRGESF